MVSEQARRLLAAVVLSVPINGCQYISGVADLNIDSETTGPDWTCLGHQVTREVTGTVNYEGSVRNVAGNVVIPSVTARFCRSSEEPCTDPLLTTQSVGSVLKFSIDSSFDGYIELDSPGMMPAVVELSRPIGAMRALPELRMLDATTLARFAFSMGSQVDTNFGSALFWAEDCSGRRGAGVSVRALGDLPEQFAQYYVVDQKLPSVSVHMTDASGGGGFINLPNTFVTFEALRAETMELISTFPGRIRPGQVTFMVIEPD
jgi:hypothetical protein